MACSCGGNNRNNCNCNGQSSCSPGYHMMDDGTCMYVNFILGCTDSNYDNYNPNANTDDGSCQ